MDGISAAFLAAAAVLAIAAIAVLLRSPATPTTAHRDGADLRECSDDSSR